MHLPKLCLAAFLPCLAMAAAPAVQSVTDSATFGPRVAPGSLASLFGTGLASSTASATDFPLPQNLGGATVSVNGTIAPLLYVSATQINFQVPSSTKSGAASVVVNGPAGASTAFSFTITPQAPSIFQYGGNHALAQNSDGTLNSSDAPAASGSYMTVYLTGQGAVDNAVADGAPTPLSPLATATATATATIGAVSASVKFLGLTPNFTGFAQANIQVPTLPTGDYPLVITAGTYIGASAVVSISGDGAAFTSPFSLASSVAFANTNPNSLALYNNIAYVCGSDRIVMVDVTDSATPSVIGQFGDSVLNGLGDRCVVDTVTGGTPLLIEIVGRDSSGQESLAVFSLANPKSPSLLTVASTPYSHIEDLSFVGVYGIATTSYITFFTNTGQVESQHGDFLVFSFANPASPVLVATLPSSTLSLMPYANVVDPNYAYVASTTATGASTTGAAVLNVINITTPAIPTQVSQVTIPQAAILLSFDVAGNTLLAAGNTTGQRNPGIPDFDFTGNLTLTALDISNPQLPAAVSTITTQLQVNGTFYTAAFSNGVFAIVNKPPASDNFGPSSLMVVDARKPATLTLYPFQTAFGFSEVVTTNNGYLLAPTATGLNIYKLQL